MTLVEQIYDELTTAVNNRDEAESLFNANPGMEERASLEYWEDEIYWLNQRLDSAQEAVA